MLRIGSPKIFKMEDEVIREVRLRSGKLLMSAIVRTESHECHDGTPSEEMKWLLVDRPDSVAVLIHDDAPDRDQIILVEQFRGSLKGNIFELPAGSMEGGGGPADTAIREVWEEVKLKIKFLKEIGRFVMTPGTTPERIILFYARVESLGPNGLISGLKSENEDILKHVVDVEDAFAMMEASDTRSRIIDAKTALALQWLKIQRLKKK